MIARQRKNLACRQKCSSSAILHEHAICSDLHYARTEERLNLPCLDAVLDVRPHPIFYRRSQLFVPVHQRYTRAIAVQVERCFGRGIFPADDDYLLIPKFVRLGVVMRNVWQLFTRHSEFIRQIVISRGDRNFPAPIFLLRSLLRARHHGKVSVAALDPNHPFILPQLQPVVFRRFAVILQRFNARGLIRSANERQVSNLQQLRRGEEHHAHGIVEDGIAQASFVDDQRLHSRPLGLNSSRKARRPRSNANNVVDSHGKFSLPGVLQNCKSRRNHCMGVCSSNAVNSRRKVSSSSRRSGVAAISFFFQTKTSAAPFFSLTLRLPSSRYDGAARSFKPPPGSDPSKAAHSPRRTHNALS